MRRLYRTRSTARGFTLIEALVALLVLSFGMLAIAGFQVTLTRSSDLAKQRTEATRLAQEKMESLRSYGQVATDPVTGSLHKFNYTDDVISGPVGPADITTTNAAFNRTWTVTANAANTEKWINVQVAWTDRAGQAQSVQLLSVISKFDPQDIGTLATGPGGNNVRRPKNRNINIPYPAVTLSGGTTSAFIPPPGNVTYVFNNVTGNIVQSCTGLTPTAQAPTPVSITSLTAPIGTTVTVVANGHALVVNNKVTIAGTTDSIFHGTFTVTSVVAGDSFTYEMTTPFTLLTTATGGTATQQVTQLAEGLDISTAAGVYCQTIDAYLLSGYVRFDVGNSPAGEEPGNATLSRYNTFPLDAGTPLSIDIGNAPTPNSGGNPTMVCYSQRQKVVTTTPSPFAITSVSRTSSTDPIVTVNAANHAFVVGNTVAINAVSNAAFIGAYEVLTVTDTDGDGDGDRFTYKLSPPLPTATSGTGGTATLVQRLTVPETTTVPGYSTILSKFVSYACVVTPVDHDTGTAGAASTPKRWWGKVTINPNTSSSVGTVWAIGAATGQYNVCRYSADFNASGSTSNSEHPLWYRGVTGALDSQNFLVIDRGEICPTDRPQNLGSPVNFADDSTAGHQPISIAERSFQCPTGGCGTKNYLEPTTTTTDLLMD